MIDRACTALALIALAACSSAPPVVRSPEPAPQAEPPHAVEDVVARLQRDAEKLEPILPSLLAQSFLRATRTLPPNKPRYYDGVSDLSCLVYARVLDLLASHGFSALGAKKRVLDFGYQSIGPSRLLASIGMDAIAVGADPALSALYNDPSDQGATGSGSVRIINGMFPADPRVAAQVGGEYDVVMAMNVLRRGAIHPPKRSDVKLDLGVSDELLLKTLHDVLRPGGFFLLYNVGPKLPLSEDAYLPAADGRSPFTAHKLEEAGFLVISLDEDDFKIANRIAHALDWGQGKSPKWDVDGDMAALFTLVERPL